MAPVFRGLADHISQFLVALDQNPQVQWDWRMDFVAHSAGIEDRDLLFRHESALNSEVIDVLYGNTQPTLARATENLGRLWRQLRRLPPTDADRQAVARAAGPEHAFFVASVDAFIRGLRRIQVYGDEATLVALDTCLDLPWRRASACHRVVVLITDEPPEQGIAYGLQQRALPDLVRKVVEKRVALHIVGPPSDALDLLAQADRSEYIVLQNGGPGLARVDFHGLLREVGQSVSRSLAAPIPTLEPVEPVGPALFGQDTWATRSSRITGA
jgi:hypothetical protein